MTLPDKIRGPMKQRTLWLVEEADALKLRRGLLKCAADADALFLSLQHRTFRGAVSLEALIRHVPGAVLKAAFNMARRDLAILE